MTLGTESIGVAVECSFGGVVVGVETRGSARSQAGDIGISYPLKVTNGSQLAVWSLLHPHTSVGPRPLPSPCPVLRHQAAVPTECV